MDWLDDERAGRHKPKPGPESTFRVTYESQMGIDRISDLLERLHKDLVAEDARMRSEVLPPAPEGWVWVSEFVRNEDIESREVSIRVRYHLRQEDDQW